MFMMAFTPLLSMAEPLNQLLYKAVVDGDVIAVSKAVQQGADINQPDKYGITLLNHAVNFNQKKMVEYLIQAGAKVNQTDESGWSPLLVAATYGYTEIAQLLLKYQADPELADKDGLTPIAQAQQKKHKKLLYYLIRAQEDRQRYNLATARNLADQVYLSAQNSFYGIQHIERLVAPKSLNEVIQTYKRVVTKQGGSLLLRVLHSEKAKRYTPVSDYINLLLLAKQHVAKKYWLSDFSLFKVLSNDARYSKPLRGMMLQNRQLDYLITHINTTKSLMIDNGGRGNFSRQPDLDIEYLLRANEGNKQTFVYQQHQEKLKQLLRLLENDIHNYCFSNMVATMGTIHGIVVVKEKSWLKVKG